LVALAWWEERIVSGIARYAAEHGWVLDCSLRLVHRVPEFAPWKGNGVIAYTGIAQSHQSLADYLRRSGLPVVSLHEDRNVLGAPSVVIEHEAIGRAGAEHLLSLDFAEYAFVEFDENAIEARRRAGFEAAIRSAGRKLRRLTRETFVRDLPGLPRPMGLMAANDVNAMEVISLCQAYGARVPEDFAIVGVDNSEVSARISPIPLTSVVCDFEEQGYQAAHLLHRVMDGASISARTVAVPPCGVSVRRSTDTIAITDIDAAHALRFLRAHFREPIRIKQLAAALHGRLRRVQASFRAETGHTMAQELMRLRLEHAKRLLVDTDSKIEGIAHESGFASRFHFHKAFRRATGCTPSEFRAHQGKASSCEERASKHAPTSTLPLRHHASSADR
jgi:LacI family transcriptional regulator